MRAPIRIGARVSALGLPAGTADEAAPLAPVSSAGDRIQDRHRLEAER